MPFFSVVPCEEIKDAYGEQLSLTNWRPSTKLVCKWNQRHALVADILGNRREWPHATGFNKPVAVSATISGSGESKTYDGSIQLLQYEEAMVQVNYDTLAIQRGNSSDDGGDDQSGIYDAVSESFEPDVEFMNLDHKLFKWADGSSLLRNESPGKRVLRAKLVRTYYGLQYLPLSMITKIGYSNNADYFSRLLGITFPAETLLVGAPSSSRSIRSDGFYGWNLTLTFSIKEEGWNKFWRQDTGQYENLHNLDGSIYYNYPPTYIGDLVH